MEGLKECAGAVFCQFPGGFSVVSCIYFMDCHCLGFCMDFLGCSTNLLRYQFQCELTWTGPTKEQGVVRTVVRLVRPGLCALCAPLAPGGPLRAAQPLPRTDHIDVAQTILTSGLKEKTNKENTRKSEINTDLPRRRCCAKVVRKVVRKGCAHVVCEIDSKSCAPQVAQGKGLVQDTSFRPAQCGFCLVDFFLSVGYIRVFLKWIFIAP